MAAKYSGRRVKSALLSTVELAAMIAAGRPVAPGTVILSSGGVAVGQTDVNGRLIRFNTLRGQMAGVGGLHSPESKINTASTGRSYTQLVTAWGPHRRVRYLLLNPTATNLSVANMMVGPTSTITDVVLPSGGNSAFSAPTGAIALPNQGTIANPGMNWTPWFTYSTLARADGSPFPASIVRAYCSDTALFPVGSGSSHNGLLDGSFAALANGHAFGSGSKNTDLVTAPGAGTGWTVDASGPVVIVFGAEYEYENLMTTVYCGGDSVLSGEREANKPSAGAEFMACTNLARQGRALTFENGGFGGQRLDDIDARVRAYLAANRPRVLILQSFTSNGTNATPGVPLTQSLWDEQWRYFAGMAAYQQSLGGDVIMWTPRPKNGQNAAFKVSREIQRQRVINSGFAYVDQEAAMTDPASNGGFLAAFTGADGTHPNNSGYLVKEALLRPVLDSFV